VTILNRLVGKFQTLKGHLKGQTMTEYALILAAVAVVAFAGYRLMGNDIQSLLTSVSSDL
jgi:Flp pilus assembly pilin Flp